MNYNNISGLLLKIENNIKNQEELAYFWTHEERYKFILQKIVETRHGASLQNIKVLDIGCYPYHIGKALEKLGFDVYGISSPHEPIKDKPNVKILNIETDKFPFKDEEFDLIIFTEVIEHLLNPKYPLIEIRRVLKKNGVLILTTPNKISPFIAFRRIFFAGKNKENNSSIYNQHNKEYSMEELKRLLEEKNFKVMESEFFISYTPFRKRKKSDMILVKFIKIVNYLLMKLIPPLKDSIFIVTIKNNF